MIGHLNREDIVFHCDRSDLALSIEIGDTLFKVKNNDKDVPIIVTNTGDKPYSKV